MQCFNWDPFIFKNNKYLIEKLKNQREILISPIVKNIYSPTDFY